jgi:hypothetical protein
MLGPTGTTAPAAGRGDGELGEALRPLFLDYPRKHPDA